MADVDNDILNEAFKDDCFNRKQLAEQVLKLIQYECPFRDDSFVISLNAPFGRGKTKFLQMFRAYYEKKSYKSILINAWEDDFADNPIVPISCSLIEGLKGIDDKDINSAKDKLIESLRATLTISSNISNNVLKLVSCGVLDVQDNVKAVKENYEKAKGSMQSVIEEDFLNTKAALKDMKTALEDFVDKIGRDKIIIVVDELDRAKPSYAIEFLEAIKHIFSIKGLVFLLAVNRKQLEISARTIFGKELDFDGYYMRFISREIYLDSAKVENYTKFNEHLFAERYNEKNPSSTQLFKNENNNRSFLDYTSKLFEKFQLEAREIERFYKEFSYFIFRENELEKNRDNNLNYIQASSFLILLKMKYFTVYNMIDKDYIGFLPKIISVLNDLGLCGSISDLSGKGADYAFGLYIYSFCQINGADFNDVKELGKANFSDDEESERTVSDNMSRNFLVAKGSSFHEIYQRLKELRTIE